MSLLISCSDCTNIPLATSKGHLDCIKRCRSRGERWTMFTIIYAIQAHRLDILKYANESGCLWSTIQFEHLYKDYVCRDKAMLSYLKQNAPDKIQHLMYLYSLSLVDREAVKLYSGNCFFRAINSNQQGLLDIGLLPEDWKKGVSNYVCLSESKFNLYDHTLSEFVLFLNEITDRLNRIIQEAPRLRQPLVVYRGVTQPYFVTNGDYCHKGFISTSTNRFTAEEFLKQDEHSSCCLLQTTLTSYTKCLYITPEESEILLPCNSVIHIVSKDEEEQEYPVYTVNILDQKN